VTRLHRGNNQEKKKEEGGAIVASLKLGESLSSMINDSKRVGKGVSDWLSGTRKGGDKMLSRTLEESERRGGQFLRCSHRTINHKKNHQNQQR